MNDSDVRTTTKRELVSRIADVTGQTKVVVRDILQRFLDEVIEELAAGNRLEFREFGVFEVRERAARVAQNPRTLEKVNVPAKKVVKFKVGRVMRQRVCDELSAEDLAAAAKSDPTVGKKNGRRASGGAAKGAAGARNGRAGMGAEQKINGSGAAGSAGDDGRSRGDQASQSAGAGSAGQSAVDEARDGASNAGAGKPAPPTPPTRKPGSPF